MEQHQPQTSERPASTSPKALVVLSDSAIRAAQPGDVLRDTTVKGLHLRCFPASKAFYLYFKTKTGIVRRPKLGELGALDIASARRAARRLLEEVAAGRDPIAERQAFKTEHTLADLWAEFVRQKLREGKKTLDQDRGHWTGKIEPALGDRRLSAITFADVTALVERIGEDAPIAANRAVALLSTMFSFAIAPLGWTEKNPCKGVSRFKERKRKRYMRGEEAPRIAEVLAREADAHPGPVAFLYLLILTGARKGEIAKAKWSQLQGTRLVLDEHKTDGGGEDRIINLPAQAMAVLARLSRDTDTITGMKDPWHFWTRVRAEVGCHDLRIHDLRHSFASAAIGAGLSLAQIGELLGHSSPATTKRYAHLVEEAASAAVATTADAIALQMGLV